MNPPSLVACVDVRLHGGRKDHRAEWIFRRQNGTFGIFMKTSEKPTPMLAPPTGAPNGIPVFELYGENEQWFHPDLVHCESIAARSSLHDWQIRPHQHNGLFQVLYLEAGSAQVRLDDTERELRAGQILLVPQRCIHGFTFERDAVGYVITIAYPLIRAIAQRMGDALASSHAPSIHCLGDDDASLRTRMAFGALDSECRQQAPHRNLLIESLLMTILIWTSRDALHVGEHHASTQGKGNQHFARFGALIEEHYCSHHLVTHYANSIGITAAHLNVISRNNTGKSALTLIHERILLEAKRNLVYTTMTVNVIGYALGFSDPAYFTRFFKRHTKLAPSDFRKQAGTSLGQ
jgi:AraC family transcriptional activator of pobA